LVGVIAGLLALAGGPLSTPAPGATAIVWGGITLGESGNAIVERLGKPDRVHVNQAGTFWYYDHLISGAALAIKLTTGNADRVTLLNRDGDPVRDPFKTQLGGKVSDLLSTRGQPTYENCYGWLVYPNDGETAWFYVVEGPTIVGIGVGRVSVVMCPTDPLSWPK
jgi:hypothetical protein